jgi:arabinan endo-1,5-alpha-L-arabinosidase
VYPYEYNTICVLNRNPVLFFVAMKRRHIDKNLCQVICKTSSVRSIHSSYFPGIGVGVLFSFLNCIFSSLTAQSSTVIVHDPVLIQQDSIYYLFCTGKGISTLSSSDMYNWQVNKPVFEKVPEWTHEAVPDFKGYIWAPDISWHNHKYYLYYSVSSFKKNTSCIGLATNTTLNPLDPEYQWIDHGIVIQSVPGRDLWNAIDPNLVVDEKGIPWLVFGSFWEGIKLVRLDSGYTVPAKPEEWYTIARRKRSFNLSERDPGDAAIEAPFIFRKNEYYYLFVSFDYCCRGIESNYKIMVGRSKMITGPYLDKEGNDMFYSGASLVLEGNTDWPGIGHNSAYTLNGKDYIIFHAYDANDQGRPKLMIREISWDENDWPVVAL